MRVSNRALREMGVFKEASVESVVAASVDQMQPSVLRSVGVGLLVWFITRWLNRRFP